MANDPRDIEAIALLDEPVRRALYEWVSLQPDAVSRDAAAAAVGVARALAAFHLDRLVRDGLLIAEYRRLTGRTGPGAGRPAKLYRRAPREFSISLPERRYEAAARVLAAALEDGSGEVPPPSVRAAAHGAGVEIGTAAREAAGPRAGRRRRREALLEALRGRGYEPRVGSEQAPSTADGDEITLANCPFHALVADHRDLVCGMNQALTSGVLEGLGETEIQAELDPAAGRCCVVLRPPSIAS